MVTPTPRAAQRAWASRPVRERLEPVRELRHLLADECDRLALAVTHDIGRPADEVIATDILPTADACKFLERHAEAILRPTRIGGRPLWLLGSRDAVHRRPCGVVGVIGTWNYPIFLNAGQIVQALTAGNGVLWKPSELVPACSEALHELFLRAGFPADLFVRLPATREAGPAVGRGGGRSRRLHRLGGGRPQAGQAARRAADPLDAGTVRVRRHACVGRRRRRVGGAGGVVRGSTLNKGQTCIAVRRAFVHRSKLPAFVAKLRTLAAGARPEPLATPGQAAQAERLVADAVGNGAAVLGGDVPRAENDPPRFRPTVSVEARADMAVCREASFAPLLAVVAFDDLDEALRDVAACPFGLGASVFTADPRRAAEIAPRLPAGMVTVNDAVAQTAHPATPFGGRGASGWGATQGADGLLALTVPQVVSLRTGTFRPHYDAGGDPATGDLLRGLLRWSHGRSVWGRVRGLWRMAGAARRVGKPASRTASRGGPRRDEACA